MKCIVIGGSGFVGRWLVKELLDTGAEVVNLDIVSPAGVLKLRKGETYFLGGKNYPMENEPLGYNFFKCVDEVYDLGAIVGTGGFSPEAAMRSLDVNTVGTLAALSAADNAGVERYYYPAMLDDFANVYTVTKKAGEMLCKIFESKSGMEIKLLRWGNIYGPGQALFPRRLVPFTIMNLLTERPVQIFGKGLQKVEMIYVKDVARITVDFMRGGPPGVMYDVNCESFFSVKDLVDLAKRLTGSESDIEHVPMRDGEDEVVDEEPIGGHWLRPEMPALFECMMPIESGLSETIKWYGERPELLKSGLGYYEATGV